MSLETLAGKPTRAYCVFLCSFPCQTEEASALNCIPHCHCFDGAGSDEELLQQWFALATPPYTKGRNIKGQEGLEVTANSVEEIQQCGK